MPIDVRELLERGAPSPLHDVDVDAVAARGRQWRGRRAAGATGTVAAVLVLTVLSMPRLLTPPTDIAFPPPDDAGAVIVGRWVSTDSDGSSQTVDITGVDGGRYQVVLHDDAATVCSGAPATLNGMGQFDSGELVLATPVLACDDGTAPVTVDGAWPEEAVRNYTLYYEAANDTLTDSNNIRWQRAVATPDPGESDRSVGPLWPQSSLQEVRQAQERATAGDPAYTWQLEPAMEDVGGDAEIFTRFLTEELGWEEFSWGATTKWSESMYRVTDVRSSTIDFIRCAPGELNSLYPDDPEGRDCAPGIDEHAYETVRVTAQQPLGVGPADIWVIQSSKTQPPFRQVDPLSVDEIARGVKPYLRARVDGKGARGYGPSTIPLLYATRGGARYERFDYEVVKGPSWPYGDVDLNVRLFADGGQTVVEQPFVLELDFSSVVTPPPPFRLTWLNYDRSEERSTTENGSPLPEPYDLVDRVRFSAESSWQRAEGGPHGPETVALSRSNEQSQLFSVVGDPLTPTGSCDVGDQPSSADALVRSLRALPNLSVSEPQPTRVGSIDALQLDITAGDPGEGCVVQPGAPEQPEDGPAVLAPRVDHNHPELTLWWGVGQENRARLYVFDVPGDRIRTVAILVMAPTSEFPTVLAAAQPILDSFALEEK